MTDSVLIKTLMDSFRRIVQSLRSSHRAAGDVDLTGAQLFVLATLGAAAGTMGVKELAEATGTDQSTVSVVAGRLVERGLVKRVRSTADTRRVELSLTVRGRNLQRKAPSTTAQTRLARALGALSEADARALARILGTVVASMGEADAPAPMLFDERGSGDGDEVRPPVEKRRPAPRAATKSATRPERKR